jgi:PAS domain S-box-containing protein
MDTFGILIAVTIVGGLVMGAVYWVARWWSKIPVPAPETTPPTGTTLESVTDPVVIAQVGGGNVVVNTHARQLFGLNGDTPNLERMARVAQPQDAFFDLFQAPGQTTLTINNHPIEATSVFISQAQQFVVTLRDHDQLTTLRGDRRSAQAMTALAEVGRALSTSTDLEVTLNSVLETAGHIVQYDVGEINLWDSDAQVLRPRARTGDRPTVITLDQTIQFYTIDEGVTGWLAQNKRPLLISDLSSYTEVKTKFNRQDIPVMSLVGVPLLFGKDDELVGTIELASFRVNAFSEQDLVLIATIGTQAAIAIRNAQRYTQQETRIAELSGLAQVAQTATTLSDTRELYASLVDRIAKLMSVQFCGFLLYDDSERALISQPPFRGIPEAFRERYRIPTPPDSPAARIWRDTEYWYTDDMRTDPRIREFGLDELAQALGMAGSLIVPLIVGGNRLGVVQVANKLTQSSFSDEDARLLRTLAGQAAVLIDNARLVRETDARAQRSEALRQISEITGSARSLTEIYQEVMSRIARLISADLGIILLLDETKGELAPQPGSEYGLPPEDAQYTRLRIDEPDFKLSTTTTRRTFYTWRASRDRRMTPQYRQMIERFNLESVIAVPFIIQDRSIGEMWWGSHRVRRFARTDVQLLATIAAQLASAIDRTRLASNTDETLRRRVEQLTALTRVGRELNQTLELEHILKLVYDEAVRATRADCGTILLLDLEAPTPTAQIRLGDNSGTTQLNLIEHDVALSGGSYIIPDLTASGALDRLLPASPGVTLAPPGHNEVRSLLVVPINYQGTTVGIIELHSNRLNAFERPMLDFSLAVAAQAAIAVGNAQRYEEQIRRGELLRRRADQLSQLLQISRSVRSDKPLATNLEAIAFGVQEAVGFNVVLISVLDPATNLLHRTACAGLPLADFEHLKQNPGRLDDISPAMQPQFRISQSYFVPHDLAPQEILNLEAGIVPRAQPTQPGEWHQDDFLFVPLLGSGGQTIGMMTVDDPRNGRVPDFNTIETLEIFANQAALAIENARLYQSAESRTAELSHSLAELQKSYRDLDAISRTLSRKEQELSSLIEQTELRARRLLALHRIASATAEARTEEDLLQRAVRSTIVEMNVDVCVIALVNEGTILQVTAQATVTDLDVDLNAYLGLHNPLSHIISIHSPLLARDLHGWSDSRLVQTLQLSSFCGVPIYISNALSGALLVGNQGANAPFNNEDIDLLTILSGQIGTGLENMRLFKEVQHRLSENTRLFTEARELQEFSNSVFESLQQGLIVLDTNSKVLSINGWIRQTFGWTEALVGQNLFEFRSIYRDLGLADAVIQAVIYDRPIERVVVRESTPDGSLVVSNFYGYPLRRDQTVTGVVLLVEDTTARAQLEADVRERATQLQALTEASRVVSSALREENVIALVLDQIGRVVPYDSATLWLREDDFLRVVSARGFEDDSAQLGLVVQIEDSRLFKEMGNTGKAVIVPDVRTDERFPAGIISRTRSWLGAPLISKGKGLGLLALDKTENGFYSANHADLAVAFANQVAVALENAQLFEQSVQRALELNERTQRLMLLNRVSGELNTTLDVNRIVEIAVQEISSSLGLAQVLAILHEIDGRIGQFIAAYPEINETVPPITLADDPVTQRLYETKAPIVIDDVAVSDLIAPAQRLQLVNQDVKSMIIVPLLAGGNLLGHVIARRSADQLRFALSEIELAQTIANQTASAVQNAQLFDETQRLFVESQQRSTELSTLYDLSVSASQVLDPARLVDITLDNVQRLMQNDTVALVRLTENNELIADAIEAGERVPSFPTPRTGSSFSEYILNSGRSIFVRDANLEQLPVPGYDRGDKPRAYVGVPMMVRGTTIGALLVQSYTPNQFTENHLRVLTQVANLTTVAFENARLFGAAQNYAASLEDRVAERTIALEKERDRVETLFRITSELSASLDLDRVLTRALSLVNDVIGGSSGGLFLLDPQSDRLIHRAALESPAPLPPGGQPAPFKRGEGLVGWVIKNQQPVIVSDLSQDERWIKRPLDERHKSAICVPLLSSEDCLGAMIFFSDTTNVFVDDQMRLVVAAANQVTSAINNAELYRLIRDQAERLGGMLRANQVEASKSRAILESVADGVLVTDFNGKITLFNATAERILQLDRDDVLGRPVRDFMGLYGNRARTLIETIERWNNDASSYHVGEYITERLNLDDKRIVSVILAPVTSIDEFLGTVSIFRDITREVEVDRLKTEFVTTVSHELRTPITPIKGYADILLMGMAGPLSPDQQRAIELIKTNADRLKDLVEDLLDISKIESGGVELELAPVPVNGLVADVVAQLESRSTTENKPMTVIVNVPADTPPALGDRQRLSQVISNLADNAFTYTPAGGSITISAHSEGDTLLISVEDNGIGISPQELGRIFERFYRGEDPLVMASSGTGLGLSIVQRLVEMHGGTLWVESEGLGHGSTFFVRLKLAPAPAETTLEAVR